MTINCNGQLIDLSQPKVMGILNFTPDSFFDGGKYHNANLVLNQVEQMLVDGADFIDLGAYSTRPGAAFVSEQEEVNRIQTILPLILKAFPEVLISIDTFRSEVAKAALDQGAAMINDIAAGMLDDQMMETVAKYNVPYIMMHMVGTPQTMQDHTQYEDILKEMMLYFSERISKAKSLGIHDIIIDLGFGFSKTLDQNYYLIKHMDYFKNLELPNLVGISRKSMLYKLLDIHPQEALNATTALNMYALDKGANILRVHDVKQAVEVVKIHQKLSAIGGDTVRF